MNQRISPLERPAKSNFQKQKGLKKMKRKIEEEEEKRIGKQAKRLDELRKGKCRKGKRA